MIDGTDEEYKCGLTISRFVLGLERIEAASFLRSNGTFQYLTGPTQLLHPIVRRRLLRAVPMYAANRGPHIRQKTDKHW
jgi:hypothetical protein